MMPKDNPNATFEYFRTADVVINGRFADYVDQMWVQNKMQESYVSRLVDLYAIAAIVGLKIGRQLKDDTTGENKRTIQLAQLTGMCQTLVPIMKLIMMLDTSRGLSEEERIRSAFNVPKTREEYNAGMELFNSYARAGIEYMYQQLVTRISDDEDDDFGDARINNIVAFLKNPMNVNDVSQF